MTFEVPVVDIAPWVEAGSYDDEARAYYFHRFYDFQPDLNTSHPEVQAEILKIMGFWIQLGVSGFRMDAVPFVIATKGPSHHIRLHIHARIRTAHTTRRNGDMRDRHRHRPRPPRQGRTRPGVRVPSLCTTTSTRMALLSP